MKIVSLELIGYQRLLLKNIQRIKITPENRTQLILGSNGSGKSSIIKEMSPLPAQHKHFTSQGKKVIILHKAHHVYHLTCDFSGEKNLYSFVKDGEELNESIHSIKEYTKLVWQEFQLTQEIFDVMTGKMNFHAMSSAERRAWFTRIADADYTYALQYFKRLTTTHRDLTGSIKRLQSRLVSEQDKLLTPEKEAVLRAQIQDLQEVEQALLNIRPAQTASPSRNIEQIHTKLQQLQQQFRRTLRRAPIPTGVVVQEDSESLTLELVGQIHHLEQQVGTLCESIDTHRKTLEAFQQSGAHSEGDVLRQISELQIQKKQLIASIHLDLEWGSIALNPYPVLQSHLALQDSLISLLQAIPRNPGKMITRESYQQATLDHQSNGIRVRELDSSVEALQMRRKELDHYRNHQQRTCPKCEHTWAEGYNEQEYIQTGTLIQQGQTALEHAEAVQKNLTLQLEVEGQYLQQLRAYFQLVKSFPVLQPFWDHIHRSDDLTERPAQIVQAYYDLKTDLETWVQVEEVSRRLEDALRMEKMIQEQHVTNLQEILTQVSQEEQQLVDHQNKLRSLKFLLEQHKAYQAMLKESAKIQQEISHELQSQQQYHDQTLVTLQRDYLNDLIQAIRSDVFHRQQQIQRVDIQKAVVSDIEKQIATQGHTASLLSMAIKQLSPNEGLIARGLTGFINHFVRQTNAFIKKVWLSPLELSTIALNEDTDLDLDYKFMMKVGESALEVEDVKEGSTGQQKMIDLAFRLISMKYLHLEDFPLFLDEFTSGLDHAHRQSAFYAVTNLLTNANFSQIFIISHYASDYSSLVNADVTVLCSDNVLLPPELTYNAHTEIS